MPPVPAGVMLDVNDDAIARSQRGRERHRLGNRTDERHRREHVRQRGPEEDERDPSPVGVSERVPRVADVRELRQQEVERGSQRDDRTAACGAGHVPTARAAPRVAAGSALARALAESSSEISPARSRRRIGRGNASGCSNGNAAATRATPRPSTAASTAASIPTSNDGLDEELGDVTSCAGGVAASSASSKSTRWGRSSASTIDVLQRQVAVRDAPVVEGADLGQSRSRSARSIRAGSISVMRSPATKSVTASPSRPVVATRSRRGSVSTRPLSVGAGQRERFVLDAALHRRVRWFDLVAAQAHGPVEPGEVVGAAIVGSAQLHEQHRRPSASVTVRERSPRRAALANGRAARGRRLGARRTSSERIRYPIRRAEHDERERSHDDADRDREHDVERAGHRRQHAQQPEQHDRGPERALPLPAHPDARQASRRRRWPRGTPNSGSPDRRASRRSHRSARSRASSREGRARRSSELHRTRRRPRRGRARRGGASAAAHQHDGDHEHTLTAITWATTDDDLLDLIGSRDTASTRSACTPPTVRSATVASRSRRRARAPPMRSRNTSLGDRTRSRRSTSTSTRRDLADVACRVRLRPRSERSGLRRRLSMSRRLRRIRR